MNRITVRATDGTERTYTLHGGNLTIGRDPGSGICLQDTQVSWQHAVLSDAGETCLIEDLGSSNGTFVGAERIQRQVLNPGESRAHRFVRAGLADARGAFADVCQRTHDVRHACIPRRQTCRASP